eukprot:scpid58868/ scgid2606/ Synaptotagmin-6; Synaptotagmin VI
MGHLAVLIAATAGGIAAFAVFIIFLCCWRRRENAQLAKHPKFARKARRRMVAPPVPVLSLETSPVTHIDHTSTAAAGYVQGDMQRGGPKSAGSPHRRPQLSSSLEQQNGLSSRPLSREGQTSGESVSSPPPLPQRGRRLSSSETLTGPASAVYPKPQAESLAERRQAYQQLKPVYTKSFTSTPAKLSRSHSDECPSTHREASLSPFARRRYFSEGITEESVDELSKSVDLSADHSPGRSPDRQIDTPDPEPEDSRLKGHLQFSLEFMYDVGCLRFRPLRLKNVQEHSLLSTTVDTFLKATLLRTNELPADGKLHISKFGQLWKSGVHSKESNPTFDDGDYSDFPCAMGRLATMGLLVLVYTHDMLVRDSLLGHIWMPLEKVNVTGAMPIWRPIEKGSRIFSNQGALQHGIIQFSLQYEAAGDRLTVVVLKASGLTADSTDYTASIDPYVTLTLLRHGRRVTRKDTPSQKSTLQPVFNVSVRFDGATTAGMIAAGTIHECSLLVSVRDKTRLRSDTVLGAALVGNLARDEGGNEHWQAMLTATGSPVVRWHTLGAKPSRRILSAAHSNTQ